MAKEVLMAYTVVDKDTGMNGLIKKIEGEPAGDLTELASIQDPDETYVPLSPEPAEHRLFSYALGRYPAVLAATVSLDAASDYAYTLAVPGADGEKAWQVLARDIVLVHTDPVTKVTAKMAANPSGVAQVGNMLYIIDHDSQMITRLGVNELNGLPPGNHELALAPYNPSGAGLPANAHGQAIIALKNGGGTYLFALYTVFDSANPPVYSGSILVKMVIDPAAGYPVYQAKVDAIAKNAQEIIYIESFGGDSGLFIPALGGPQKYDGTTNGVDSKLEMVRPFASGGMTKTTILTGDPLSAAPTTWDIRAFASPPDTGPTDFIFLLTGTMDTAYNQNWRLYKPTTTDLNKVIGKTLTAAGLKVADEGTGSPGNYWDVYYENGTGHIPLTESSGDRLWFFKGSPICVAVADGYLSSPRKLFGTGYAQGQIGGINVDSATLVTEAVKQAAAGVSLKRGLRGSFRIPRRKETEEKK